VGDNILSWTVSAGVCPAASDEVTITVHDLIIPTLITPNGDPFNEYFVLRGLETLGKTEVTIFDRRGAQVYKNTNYDNSWNGLDYNGNELPDDTYFYVVKSQNGKSLSGYIVIRR
jgi:gliding motility-associated-like protein